MSVRAREWALASKCGRRRQTYPARDTVANIVLSLIFTHYTNCQWLHGLISFSSRLPVLPVVHPSNIFFYRTYRSLTKDHTTTSHAFRSSASSGRGANYPCIFSVGLPTFWIKVIPVRDHIILVVIDWCSMSSIYKLIQTIRLYLKLTAGLVRDDPHTLQQRFSPNASKDTQYNSREKNHYFYFFSNSVEIHAVHSIIHGSNTTSSDDARIVKKTTDRRSISH